jgi:hypothetical protein
LAAHDPGVAEFAENVLEEVERDVLGGRDPLGLDRSTVRAGGELDRRAHRVIRLGRDAHFRAAPSGTRGDERPKVRRPS